MHCCQVMYQSLCTKLFYKVKQSENSTKTESGSSSVQEKLKYVVGSLIFFSKYLLLKVNLMIHFQIKVSIWFENFS